MWKARQRGRRAQRKRKKDARSPSQIIILFRHRGVHDLRAIGSKRIRRIHGCKPERLADLAFGLGGRLHVEDIDLRCAPPAHAGGWVGVVLATTGARRKLLPAEVRQRAVRVGVTICQRRGRRGPVDVRLVGKDTNIT